MKKFPSLPFTPIPIAGKRWQTPEASAAYYGEDDKLQQRFDEGASPNATHPNVISPLEAAILGGKPECVKLILSHPAFDPTPSDAVLDALANNGMDNAVSVCCELAAPAVLGCRFVSTAHEPLPEQIKLCHILRAGNWTLLIRFVEHNEIDKNARRCIADQMCWKALEKNPLYGILILARLLTACPELLKHRVIQQCFVALSLSNPNGIPQELRPFVQLLPKKIVLTDGSAFNWGGAGNLLSRWRTHLGAHTSPCLDLGKHLPDSEPSEDAVEHLLRMCLITGKVPKSISSPLLIDIIAYASEDTLRAHLQSDGKLAFIGHDAITQAAQALLVSSERRTFLENLYKEDD